MDIFTLKASNGVSAQVIPLGARLIGYETPDRNGQFVSIIQGFDDLAAYETDTAYRGAIVGRVANRIADATYWLNGVRYQLDANEGPHHLHGGGFGCSQELWTVQTADQQSVTMQVLSPDGEGGYGGTVLLSVIYHLAEDGALTIRCESQAQDQETVINLTNHAYFNLAGQGAGSLEGHRLSLNADHVLLSDDAAIPLSPTPVAGTCFDFRQKRVIQDQLALSHPQLDKARGFDHCYCLSQTQYPRRLVAELDHVPTGRGLKIETTEAGLQLYTGNYLPQPQSAVCLEAQNWPNSPNRDDFPNCIVKKGETLVQETRLVPFAF